MIVHGVDFSGARSARKKICVATLEPIALKPPSAPLELIARVERGIGHAELVERIARSGDDGRRHAWLIDATFGLPLELLAEHGIEAKWAAAARWLASFPTARDWRRACRKRSRKEHRRAADRVARTPFAPTNLRMFKQTWHSIVSVLLPLCEEPDVTLWPLDMRPFDVRPLNVRPLDVPGPGAAGPADETLLAARRARRVWVGEGCPSSVLRAAGLPHRGYKGPTEGNRDLRTVLLRSLEGAAPPGLSGSLLEGEAPSAPSGLLPPRREPEGAVPPASFRIAPDAAALAADDPEGDILDALLLLPAALRFAASDPAAVLAVEPRASVEGWVYL